MYRNKNFWWVSVGSCPHESMVVSATMIFSFLFSQKRRLNLKRKIQTLKSLIPDSDKVWQFLPILLDLVLLLILYLFILIARIWRIYHLILQSDMISILDEAIKYMESLKLQVEVGYLVQFFLHNWSFLRGCLIMKEKTDALFTMEKDLLNEIEKENFP